MVRISLSVLLLACVVTAGEELNIGDKGPAIEISHWVKGDPVEFQEGRVYVLEFWATWCGPCIASMPHITGIQRQYGDRVTVVGVSDEPLETVTAWLQRKDEKGAAYSERVGYRLTTDPDKSVKDAYFTAAGQKGIPCSFIIGKSGHVEWIGHPMAMDGPLEQVVADTWDREVFKKKFEQDRAFDNAMRAAGAKLREAIQKQDFDAATKVLDGVIERFPNLAQPKHQKFMVLLTFANRPEQAYKMGESLLASVWDDAMMLNQIAWTVLDDARVQMRDLDFAMKAARRASELTESRDAAILDTLARAWYERGELDTAIEWQRKAVGHAGQDEMGKQIRQVLEKYQREAELKRQMY